jgi:acyl-CoA hydrolase
MSGIFFWLMGWRALNRRGRGINPGRSDIMYVVTEYGMVNLKGKSVAERAKALIGITHPDFREGLERQA